MVPNRSPGGLWFQSNLEVGVLLYIICPVLVVLGSPFASRFPWLRICTLYWPSLLCTPSSTKLANDITIIVTGMLNQLKWPTLQQRCRLILHNVNHPGLLSSHMFSNGKYQALPAYFKFKLRQNVIRD